MPLLASPQAPLCCPSDGSIDSPAHHKFTKVPSSSLVALQALPVKPTQSTPKQTQLFKPLQPSGASRAFQPIEQRFNLNPCNVSHNGTGEQFDEMGGL